MSGAEKVEVAILIETDDDGVTYDESWRAEVSCATQHEVGDGVGVVCGGLEVLDLFSLRDDDVSCLSDELKGVFATELLRR